MAGLGNLVDQKANVRMVEVRVLRTLHQYQKASLLKLSNRFQFTGVATREVRTPSPKEGEILIQVAASSVNPCDVV